MTHEKAMAELEKLMKENKDVLIRLKEGEEKNEESRTGRNGLSADYVFTGTERKEERK